MPEYSRNTGPFVCGLPFNELYDGKDVRLGQFDALFLSCRREIFIGHCCPDLANLTANPLRQPPVDFPGGLHIRASQALLPPVGPARFGMPGCAVTWEVSLPPAPACSLPGVRQPTSDLFTDPCDDVIDQRQSLRFHNEPMLSTRIDLPIYGGKVPDRLAG